MTTDMKIEAMIQVASRLVEIMEREIALLSEMKSGEVAALQEEKEKLTALYEEAVAEIAKAPEVLQSIAPALQTEFGEMARNLNRVIGANENAIRAARTAHDRVLHAIVTAVKEQRGRTQAYSANGLTADRQFRSGVAGQSLSLTLDRQL